MSQVPPPPSSPIPPPPPPPPPPGGWAPPTQLPTAVAHSAGAPLASPGRRLLGYVLDVVLVIVTLFIGWFIWSLIVWKDGLSPAKQILKMRVVKIDTRQIATWGTMALRELVGKWLIFTVLSFIPLLPFVLYFMLLWDKNRQELWDKVASTLVIDERDIPSGLNAPR